MRGDASVLKQVIFLMGPTASGKTELALRLCDRLPCEIISVDSAMIYRGMDIGTGKPAPEIQDRYPHHLIDILDPSERYSAALFCQDASRIIDEIHSRNRIPLLVGGTHLYFRALEQGLSPLPGAHEGIREQLNRRAIEQGWPALHAELKAKDPASAARIHPNDYQRIQRALEIIMLTGKTPSRCYETGQPLTSRWQIWKFALDGEPRPRLHKQIETRFQDMMRQGLLEEVRQLYERDDLSDALPSIRSVGYRQLWRHLQGRWSLEEAIFRAVIATRQLAKRQMTWLRKEDNIHLLEMGSRGNTEQMLGILDT